MTPSLDKLIDDVNMIKNEGFENETATWFDVGTRFKSLNGQWAGSLITTMHYGLIELKVVLLKT